MNNMIEVTQRVEFECCYLFQQQLECHKCKLEVTVSGPQRFEDTGVVISYEALKQYMRDIVPNKKFLYNKDDNAGNLVAKALDLSLSVGSSTQEFDFPISAENLVDYFAETLQDTFDRCEPGIILLDMKLREDASSYVSWRRAP